MKVTSPINTIGNNSLYLIVTRINVFLIVCLFVLVLLISAASLSWPFGWDQGIFAWVGDVIIHGGMPYRDGWEMKGPLVYYIYAAAQYIFGRNLWGIRIVDLTILLIGSYLIAGFIAQYSSNKVGRWSFVIFILWYFSGNYWHTAQPDGWASMFIVLGLVPMLSPRGAHKHIKLILAGVLIGCAILIKPLYALFLVLAFLIVTFELRPSMRGILVGWLIIFLGVFFSITVCVVWFVHRGAIQELINIWLIYPFTIYSGITTLSAGLRIRGIIEYTLFGDLLALMLPAAGVGVYSLWLKSKSKAVVLVLWTLISLTIVVLQNKFFLYHWVIIYPPVAILCAVGFYHVFNFSYPNSRSDPNYNYRPTFLLVIILLGLLIVQTAIHPAYESAKWLAYVSGLMSNDQYYSSFGIPGPSMQAAKYVQERTQPEENIFVWGWNAEIYYLSNRQSSTRFGFSMPLLLGEGTKQYKSYRDEFVNSIKSDPPAYIVIGPLPELILQGSYDLDDFSEFAEIVSDRYYKEREFGDLMIYKFKG